MLAAVLGAAILLLASSCAPGGAGEGGRITVLAAVSLAEPLREIGRRFEEAGGVEVRFGFAGSQQVVAQVLAGAPADVAATADRPTMERLRAAGSLGAEPGVFARNLLAIVVESGNPEGVRSLADLAQPGLVVVLPAPAVPAGRYARDLLRRAGVEVRSVSEEESVRAVVTKVALGEADAGLAYRTDVRGVRGVEAVEVPEAAAVVAEYLIAPLRESSNPDAAAAFVALVRAEEGAAALRAAGFLS